MDIDDEGGSIEMSITALKANEINSMTRYYDVIGDGMLDYKVFVSRSDGARFVINRGTDGHPLPFAYIGSDGRALCVFSDYDSAFVMDVPAVRRHADDVENDGDHSHAAMIREVADDLELIQDNLLAEAGDDEPDDDSSDDDSDGIINIVVGCEGAEEVEGLVGRLESSFSSISVIANVQRSEHLFSLYIGGGSEDDECSKAQLMIIRWAVSSLKRSARFVDLPTRGCCDMIVRGDEEE